MKQVDAAKVAESRSLMLQRLEAASEPWLSAHQLRGGKKGLVHLTAFEQLCAERVLVEVGQKQRTRMYARAQPGQGAKAVALALAEYHLDRLEAARANLPYRLKPIPLRDVRKPTAPKHLPSGVRGQLLDALRLRMKRGAAFPLKIGAVDYFLFASDLRAALGSELQAQAPAVGRAEPETAGEPLAAVDVVASEPAGETSPQTSDSSAQTVAGPAGKVDPLQAQAVQGNAACPGKPAAPAAAGPSASTVPGTGDPAVAGRIRDAYRVLRAQTGLRNVHISELEVRSGVGRSLLHDFLNSERRARRANATLGEPSVATAAQLAAALSIEGQPHIYIELYE